jgi:chitin synthase
MMLPPMGFNAGPHAGSDYSQSLLPPQFPGMGAPRNTMMSLNSFAGSMPGPPSSYGGGNFPNQLGLGGGMGNARMSTFSLATTANLFGATPPSDSTDPTDDEILAELRHYLSSQDLMTVTKKSVSTAADRRAS